MIGVRDACPAAHLSKVNWLASLVCISYIPCFITSNILKKKKKKVQLIKRAKNLKIKKAQRPQGLSKYMKIKRKDPK